MRVQIWRSKVSSKSMVSDENVGANTEISKVFQTKTSFGDVSKALSLLTLRKMYWMGARRDQYVALRWWACNIRLATNTRLERLQVELETAKTELETTRMELSYMQVEADEARSQSARSAEKLAAFSKQKHAKNPVEGEIDAELKKHKALRALKTSMETESQQKSRSVALRQLKQILTRLMKGEVVMRLVCWRAATERRIAELRRDALKSEAQCIQRSSSVRQLQGILSRLWTDEVFMRLQAWKSGTKLQTKNNAEDSLRTLIEDHHMSNTKNFEQFAKSKKGIAVRTLQRLGKRLEKQNLRRHFKAIDTNYRTHTHENETKMRDQLISGHSSMRETAALKQMAQIMTRMTQNNLLVLLRVWSAHVKNYAEEQVVAWRAEAEKQIAQKEKELKNLTEAIYQGINGYS